MVLSGRVSLGGVEVPGWVVSRVGVMIWFRRGGGEIMNEVSR